MEKVCSRCKNPKPADLSHFRINTNVKCGLDSWCLDCEKANGREYYRNRNIPPKKVGKKNCTKCNVEKQRKEFPANKTTYDGRSSWCRACYNEKNKEYDYKKYYNAEKRKISNKIYKLQHDKQCKEYQRKYQKDYIANPVNSRKQYLSTLIKKSGIKNDIQECEACKTPTDKIYAYVPEKIVIKTLNVKRLTIEQIQNEINFLCVKCMLKNRKYEN